MIGFIKVYILFQVVLFMHVDEHTWLCLYHTIPCSQMTVCLEFVYNIFMMFHVQAPKLIPVDLHSFIT